MSNQTTGENDNLAMNEDNSQYNYIFKVILIGDSNTGKTSIINRYVNDKFQPKYICTIGVDFLMKKVVLDNDQKVVKLQIWDTAGMEKFKQITSTYYRGAQGAIVVFDLTNRSSFESVPKWVDDFCQLSNPKFHHSIFIVGNKRDMETQIEVTQEEIDNYCNRNNFRYFEVSARTGLGVNKMFMNFTVELVDKYKKSETTFSPLGTTGNAINLDTSVKQKEDDEKGGCC